MEEKTQGEGRALEVLKLLDLCPDLFGASSILGRQTRSLGSTGLGGAGSRLTLPVQPFDQYSTI